MKNLVEKLPDQQPALRVMAMPPDTNQYGDVFGGWIMHQRRLRAHHPRL